MISEKKIDIINEHVAHNLKILSDFWYFHGFTGLKQAKLSF